MGATDCGTLPAFADVIWEKAACRSILGYWHTGSSGASVIGYSPLVEPVV